MLFCCLEKIIFAIFVFPIPPPTYFFRKHVNYEKDKNKVPMNKPYNIQNTNICNGIFHISFFKALLTNECEATGMKRPGVHWSTAVRFRCGVLVWVLYCLTSYSSLCSWIEYQEIVICIYMYYRRAMQKCRSRRDRMVVKLD